MDYTFTRIHLLTCSTRTSLKSPQKAFILISKIRKFPQPGREAAMCSVLLMWLIIWNLNCNSSAWVRCSPWWAAEAHNVQFSAIGFIFPLHASIIAPSHPKKHFQFARDVNYHFCVFREHLKTYQKSLVCHSIHCTLLMRIFYAFGSRRGVANIMKEVFSHFALLFRKPSSINF